MNQDDILSKKLAEAEERKNRFLARRIEASDVELRNDTQGNRPNNRALQVTRLSGAWLL